MPNRLETARGGVVRYRTVTTGTGKNRRVIHVAIVRKKGPRGGTTVAGQPHKVKGK